MGKQKDGNLSTEMANVTTDMHIVDILNPEEDSALVPINLGDVTSPVEGVIDFDTLFVSGNNVTLTNSKISTQVVIPAGWSVGVAVLVYSTQAAVGDAVTDAQRRDQIVAWFKLAQSGTQYVYPCAGYAGYFSGNSIIRWLENHFTGGLICQSEQAD